MTYTGPAEIGSDSRAEFRRTDVWLADHFGAAPTLDDGFADLPGELRAAVAQLPPSMRRMAVQGAGWERSSDGWVGAAWTVSNFRLRRPGQFEFLSNDGLLFESEPVVTHGAAFTTMGAPVPQRLEQDLLRNLRRTLEHRTSIWPVIWFLVEAVREVAKRDQTVGEDIMVTVLPRHRAADDDDAQGVMMQNVSLSTPTSFYFPKDSDLAVTHAPHFACRGVTLGGMTLVQGDTTRLSGTGKFHR